MPIKRRGQLKDGKIQRRQAVGVPLASAAQASTGMVAEVNRSEKWSGNGKINVRNVGKTLSIQYYLQLLRRDNVLRQER